MAKNMKQLRMLFAAQVKETFRERQVWFWSIVFPVLLMVIFMVIFGGSSDFSAKVAIVGERSGAAAETFVAAAEATGVLEIEQGIALQEAESKLKDNRVDAVIVLPDSGEAGEFRLLLNAERQTSSTSQAIGSIAGQLTAAANTGFRLPTFNDLYYPVYGNPNLRPETSRNVEAGLRYRHAAGEASVLAYRNEIENLIQYQGYTQVANKNAVIKGVTVSATQRLGATTVRGSVDWMDPRDDNTGQMLTRRPRTALKIAADHRIGPWRLGAEWLASGYRMDNSFNATTFSNEVTRLGGYSVLNLVASYDIDRKTQVQLRWNNVTDKDYELVRGYATPGSNVFVTLTYRP